MDDDLVQMDQASPNVALIRLNRPHVRNAMNVKLAEAVMAALAQRQDQRAIVLTGSDPAFCAGLDLKNLVVD